MELRQIAPFLRFAARMQYDRAFNAKAVRGTDCRLFYVLEGCAHVQIGAESYDLTPDSLLYLSAGSIYTISTDTGFSLISLNFDLEEAWQTQTAPISPQGDPALWDSLPVHSSTVTDSPFLSSHLFLEDGSSLQSGIEKIVGEFALQDPFSGAILHSQLKLLLLRLHRLEQPQLPPKLQLVHSYIRTHYSEPLSNRVLADLAGYHEYHLNRLYAAATGLTLHEDLAAVRLSRAAAKILSSDAPLQEIAEACGFTSYPHFSACFKQTFGSSPAQYRKRLKGSI